MQPKCCKCICFLEGRSEETSARLFLGDYDLKGPFYYSYGLLGAGFRFLGRVVHDNHLEDDLVFPFIPELPGSRVHPWRLEAYKRVRECNLSLQ